MELFEIYISESFTDLDYLSARFEKFCLEEVAVKIGMSYYKVNFYQKEMIPYFNRFGFPMYTLPGLMIVDSLEKDYLNSVLEFLIQNNYFKSQKKYKSFKAMHLWPGGEMKLLSSLISLPFK